MNLTHGLRRALQVKPDGLAIVEADTRRSWREVGDRVSRLAGGLSGLGVDVGDRVAILALNSGRYLETYFAVAWAGAVVVPLNIRWAVAENLDALQDCRAKVLIVDRAFLPVAQQLAEQITGLKLVYADADAAPDGMVHFEDLVTSAPVPDAMADRDDLAGVFYTGGTTGRSKGVMLSHGNLTANALNCLGEGLFPDGSVYLHAAPMFHLANGAAMFSMMLGASTNAVLRTFSPAGMAEAVARHGVTDVLLVPTMIQMFVDSPDIHAHDLSSLRRIVYGASPISEAVLDRAQATLPETQFIQLYGMTELSPAATVLHWRDHIGPAREQGRHRSAGRAVLGTEVRIVDEADRPLAFGEVGEIAVRGDTVMMGYWERPEETAKAVKNGWMHTGDGGYMAPDGYVYVVDRIKDMIISGGENVYSVEVENTIARHPAVAQCAVIGIPSDQWGEQVHAVVVTKPGAELTEDDLIAFCRDRIAGYKCPRSADISEQPLPMSGAGKILKRELRGPFWTAKERSIS